MDVYFLFFESNNYAIFGVQLRCYEIKTHFNRIGVHFDGFPKPSNPLAGW